MEVQASRIEDLEDDKRNVFLKASKTGRELSDMKTLLSRMDIKDPDSESIVFALSRKDAVRVFKVLDGTDDEGSDEADELGEVEKVTSQMQEVRLNDSRSRFARESIAMARKRSKQQRRRVRKDEAG